MSTVKSACCFRREKVSAAPKQIERRRKNKFKRITTSVDALPGRAGISSRHSGRQSPGNMAQAVPVQRPETSKREVTP